MEFAAALITLDLGYAGHKEKNRAVFEEHLQKALAGSKQDSLLAKNLATHFSDAVKAASVKAAAR
jgi:hypothetical protein